MGKNNIVMQLAQDYYSLVLDSRRPRSTSTTYIVATLLKLKKKTIFRDVLFYRSSFYVAERKRIAFKCKKHVLVRYRRS